jgi:ATP-dependent helicase/nuclease subunit B
MERVRTFGFGDDFIERLAELIAGEIAPATTDLSRVCVVFGGKRPQLFLRKALAERFKRGFFPPATFSMDEFAQYLAAKPQPFRRAEELHNCFLLYKLAKEKLPELLRNRESFSRFLAWSREILKFIEQLDLQDIPEGPLREIEISAAIGYEVPESVNGLLRNINLLRGDFHEQLKAGGALTRGMIYREASRAAAKEQFPEFDTIIFCNFYFLHATEQRILKELYDSGKAVLVFQRDARDWPVLDKMEREMGIAIRPPQEEPRRPRMTIHSAFDTHAAVGCVRSILGTIPADERTVVVLPDPDALVPLLSEIADLPKELNVSLGYPVKRSSLYSLFSLIFAAQSSRKGRAYYARDYLRALSHPLVKNLCVLSGCDPSVSRVLVHKVEETLSGIIDSPISGKLFVALEEIESSPELFRSCRQTLAHMGLQATVELLKQLLAELHGLLFASWEGPEDFGDFCDSVERLLTTIIDKSPIESYPLNLLVCEKIFAITALLRRGGFETEEFGREELSRIFLRDLESQVLSFTGSPLKGLQVLGLFETRSLNFEHVIVMDLNEKSLPNLSIYEPLIPREIMLGLGLDRIEKEDEIQRYQFFRLIGGACSCHLIFNSREDKEKSRFLEEILWEEQKRTGEMRIDIPRVAFTVNIQPEKREAAKTPAMIEFLKTKVYSASSVNTYLNCPMKFYYQYVLGLEEKTDLLGETEAADVGTFCHDLLEEAFKPFIGRKPEIDPRFTKAFFELFEKRFTTAFERKMRSDSFMLKEILSLRLRNFLEKEAQRGVKTVISLEQERREALPLDCGIFNFTYRIDRIDLLEDESLLVIDYKTGSTDLKPAPFAAIAAKGLSRRELKKSLKSFQMPLYLYFSGRKYPADAINAGLYSLRSASINLLLRADELERKDAATGVYLACLNSLFLELLDPRTPFSFDEDNALFCAGCPFSCLCR